MRTKALLLLAMAMAAIGSASSFAQAPTQRLPPAGPIEAAQFRTQYVRLGQQGEGLLYEPTVASGAKGRIALIFAHPNANVFNYPVGPELARRGYRILMANYRGGEVRNEAYLPTLSRGIAYLRTLPGVTKVVVIGHSGGGHLIPQYANVALNGPSACQGPEKLYSCDTQAMTGLEKPDGMVLIDPTLGAFHQMSSVDPAQRGDKRIAALDMFSAANGYDAATGKATFTPEFAKRFYAAQSARNKQIVDNAVARLKAIEAGKGAFSDNEPLVISGMGVNAAGARLYQPDLSLVERTHNPETVLKASGQSVVEVAHTVRPPSGQQTVDNLRSLAVMTQNTTVRDFLSDFAVRTGPNFAVTADNILDVDWKSSMTSTPANVEGVTVPSMILSMGCHYLIVPGEIVYEHLAARDKSFAVVEGAVHNFTACDAKYGDTTKRTFDYVDAWLAKPGRF